MFDATPHQLYEQAVSHHDAGRLREAEALYRQVLASQPGHADALHMLGVLAHQVGHHAAGLDLVRRAIAIRPTDGAFHGNAASILQALGRREEAIAAYRQLVRLRPDLPEAHYALAFALAESGKKDEAIALYRKAIVLRPEYFDAINNLAGLLTASGQNEEAASLYRRAVALRPQSAEAHYNLGTVLADKEGALAAIECFRKALSLRPQFPEALANLAKAQLELGQIPEAMQSSRAALAIRPDFAEAHANLGSALLAEGKVDEAIAHLRQAAQLRPDANTLNNLGIAVRAGGQIDEAMAIHLRALAADPGSAAARFSVGFIHLLRGNYALGWPDYEAHWQLRPELFRDLPGLPWNGSSLGGKRILLQSDQGLGDMLQFARFIPLVKARGGEVILRCQPGLRRLLNGQCGIDRIVTVEEPPPEAEVHCRVTGLPRLLGITLESLPAGVPYFRADEALVTQWHQRLHDDGRLKVGLVWAGNPDQKDDRTRSMRLDALAPLGDVAEAHFYNLQKGSAAAQALTPPAGMELVDLTASISDFADTAAFIANLDLVITVDTSTAHLTGAMGKPLWVMTSFSPDWRWMEKRMDSPWYPTARLFRQVKYADWFEPVRQVSEALRILATQTPGSRPPG